MIAPGIFRIEPWSITESELHLDHLGETESIFALSNGHIGLRGNLDEGEPHHTPGSYLNGFFETLPLPYAEGGYGYPEEGQSMIDVTNGKLMRILVDDEPFDIRYGSLVRHERSLDLREGVLHREVEWISPAGQRVRIRTIRLVSFVQRSIAAVYCEIEPIDASARIVIQSTLVANEPLPDEKGDPRAAAALRAPLVNDFYTNNGYSAALGHQTRSSGLRVVAGIDHDFHGPKGTIIGSESEPDLARVTLSTELEPGEKVWMVKYLGYGWSSERSMPALRDQVDAALSAAKRVGWNGLRSGQREYLDKFWSQADVIVEGDDELQQAVRFAVFQSVQASARAEKRAIPAKGLTGRGYDGHSFWDTETYTLPLLTYTLPEAARDALCWRHSTIDLAKARARELRLAGAAFPWRTIRGEECSGYWPAGTASFHINADIADAVRRYVDATDDTEFMQGAGIELLVETARLWMALGHHDTEGRFRIDGVTGPDEYTAIVDNNVFTNLMAARNLRTAAMVCFTYPERAIELYVDQVEIRSWLHAAETMSIPFDHQLGVTAQSEQFTRYRQWAFAATGEHEYPLLLSYPYYLLYSSQVIKQADLVMALYMCGDSFTREQKLRDFNYYEPITVRDSTLSASIQAIVAAEVGHLNLAYEYFRETALVDLHNLAGNTEDGLHLASLSGTWLVAVAGFGGMRDYGDTLSFAPRLPKPLTRLAFRLTYRGRCMQVEVHADHAVYSLMGGDPLTVLHHGQSITLDPDKPQTLGYPRLEEPPPTSPPPGRDPGRQGIGANGVLYPPVPM